jgi:hypothetical protein
MAQLDSSRILYCDTDSIMFIHKKTEAPILTTGNFLGDLTNELPTNVEITGYYCAGPKFYLLTGRNVVTDEPYSVQKIKGMSLNKSTEAVLNPENIIRLVMDEIAEKRLEAPFEIIRREKRTGRLVNSSCMKLCRVTNSKRIFYPADGLSVPFGYVAL